MYKYIVLLAWGFVLGLPTPSALAQSPIVEQDTSTLTRPDTLTTLRQFLKQGHIKGHAKSYWMATDNQKGLSDAYAWGIGAGIGYESPLIAHHFKIGLSGFFIFNVLSSDLSRPDPATGQMNRYEVGLFNLKEPGDHEDLDRMEELYLRYHFGKKSSLTLGRQIPHSPFINPQDGRMRPTLTEGLVLKWSELPHTVVQAEYLSRISPRSTVEWFGIGESIGLYPSGVDITGSPSQYKGNTDTRGLFQLGVSRDMPRTRVEVWNTYVPNLFNTVYAKAELHLSESTQPQWFGGIQAGYQQAAGQGGNPDPDKAYNQVGNRSLFFSGQTGYKTPHWSWALNTTRITAHGRYLMPREWGRDPFYTFLPRERNEGLGGVSAGSVNVVYTPTPQWKWEVHSGVYHLPDPSNYRLNKYGMPSYAQLNVDVSYQFKGLLEGLDAHMLVARKEPLRAGDVENDRHIFNKVNMTHFDFILNFHY